MQRRVGELLQASLTSAGYDVTLREVQLPDTYGYVKHLKTAPDLMLQTNTPDAAHPDTWARIVFYSTGGLNFFGYNDKQVDKALDDALDAPQAEATKLYLGRRPAGDRLRRDVLPRRREEHLRRQQEPARASRTSSSIRGRCRTRR